VMITINPITSTIFECCLMAKIEKYLSTDKRQFRFKKSTGCSNAIYVLKETVDLFTRNDSTVNLGCLDLSKAFDKVNHSGFLLKNCFLVKKLVFKSIISSSIP